MKTVPTLAATATLLGASALGLGFGRETEPPYPSKKRKASLAQNEPRRPSTQAAVQTTTSSTSSTAFPTVTAAAAPLPSASYPRSHTSRAPTAAARFTSHERPRPLRRLTVGDPASQPLQAPNGSGCTTPSELNINDLDPFAGRPQSRRASWIKRLSVISNSQPSSRDTSPGPLSPSVSCSNGSMAFSHDGSTAPMIPGERPPPPLPPNKLVKRSSSVRSPGEKPTQNTSSRLPSFRRPATSHQRSATLQHRTALLEMTVENPSSDEQQLQPNTDSEVEYTHFFTARVTKEKTLSKRKGALSSNAKAIKRIVPDGKMHRPTLLLARSVSAGAASHVVEDSESEDETESVYFVSRPGTPLDPPVVTALQDDSSQQTGSKHSRSSEDNVENATRSRRSFSISTLLSPRSRPQTTGLPGAKLVRKLSQRRVSSDPFSTMEKRPSSTAHGDFGAISGRRDVTDPALARREISTSSGPHARTSRHGAPAASLTSPLPAPPRRAAARADPTPESMRSGDVTPSAATATNHPPPSPTVAQTGARPSRNSMAASEQASTLVGSDNDVRGAGTGDEDDADLQSETVFDSLRTGGARSTSGARGPRIETIFDESPPSKVKVTALRDLLPKGTFREQAVDAAPGQQSIAEEEENLSTPVRTTVPDRSIHDSPTYSRGTTTALFPTLIPSSPPDMPKPLNLGTLEWDSRVEDDGSSSAWSIGDDDEDSWGDLPPRLPAMLASPLPLGRPTPQLFASRTSPKPTTPQHLNFDHGDRDTRSSIFDWSEQQPADKSSGNRTPPRPSTVHGKKDADRRGSRAVGRRAPSGLHARSQSVPVVPDATGKRSTVVTNKFGTWGVGSKGVTEDWNDDFDFSDVDEETSVPGTVQSQRIDSGMAMVVPNHIQEQQNNVLANIGLLREWGLLIEELKEQRVRAACLGILDGSHAAMWEEVDAMIDLADQEAEHDGVPRLSPPSSPSFDEVAFDDVSRSSPIPNGTEKRRPGLASNALGKHNTPSKSPSNHSKRKTILPPNHQIFGPQSSPVPPKPRYESSPSPATSPPPVGRPRKDSEAKARSIIEALQKRRSVHESFAEIQPPTPTKKVPFDTATLRRIVPHVNGLTHRVKQSLREAEGLYSSPSTSPNKEGVTPFSKEFLAENELSTQMKLMTVM